MSWAALKPNFLTSEGVLPDLRYINLDMKRGRTRLKRFFNAQLKIYSAKPKRGIKFSGYEHSERILTCTNGLLYKGIKDINVSLDTIHNSF